MKNRCFHFPPPDDVFKHLSTWSFVSLKYEFKLLNWQRSEMEKKFQEPYFLRFNDLQIPGSLQFEILINQPFFVAWPLLDLKGRISQLFKETVVLQRWHFSQDLFL